MTQAEFDKQVAQDAQRLIEQGAKRWEEQEAEARRIEWLQVQRQNNYLSMTGQIGIGG
jgi:hypothetical protein